MTDAPPARLAVVGGGPAGLMAAEVARARGLSVDLYEAKGSVGRKFLLAGKGGLNLTHSDPKPVFVERYGARRDQIARWLEPFGADDLRAWARELGIETFVGSSGRVFPSDLKAAPLLRRWVHRLREQGVKFHAHHYCTNVSDGSLTFTTSTGVREVPFDVAILAMGGGSWPQLGSDGCWTAWLSARGVDIAPLQPSNCGFDARWSEVFATKYAGAPVKTVAISHAGDDDTVRTVHGEFVITATGVEGSAIYALSGALRDSISKHGSATLSLDLSPARKLERLRSELARPRKGRSLTEHLRRSAGIEGVKASLLYEIMPRESMNDVDRLAAAIKSLPLTLRRARPLEEAISTAGGVTFDALNDSLMLKALPGVFCAGEMLDWEAPTGGYLLTACFASGRLAAESAARYQGTSAGL